MLRKLYEIKKNDFEIHMILVAVALLLVIVGEIVSCINNRNEEIASILLIVIMICLEVFGIGTAKSDYNISITMGNTRKNHIISEIFMLLFETVVLLILAYLFHIIHLKIVGNDIRNEIGKWIFKAQYIIIGIIGYTTVISFFKFMIIRFEKKAIIGIWMFDMALCIIISRIGLSDEKNNSVMAEYIRKFIKILTNINKNEWFAIVLAVLILLLILSGYFGMKTEVSN